MLPNKFAKICNKCNFTVLAYKGVCEKRNGSWIVEHIDCSHPNIVADERPPIPVRSRQSQLSDEELDNAHPAFRSMDQDADLFSF